MPTNRELLIAHRKRQKGLPVKVDKTIAEPAKSFSRKIDRATPKKTGTQTRGIGGRIEPPDLGLATEGIKDVGSALEREFPQKKTVDSLVEEVSTGIPSNVSIAPKRITRPTTAGVSSFGLPTDRLPSFSELGGAIGQMFKFVGGLTKKREALGLIPGKVTIPTKFQGLSLTQKDRATILAKRLDDLTLTDDERTGIKAELDAILHPDKKSDATDIEAILNE